MPMIPHYPHDLWADEVLLDPNTFERSCVHLRNGDGIQAPGFRERLHARQRLRASLSRLSRQVR